MRWPVSVLDQQTVPAAVFGRPRGGQAIGRQCNTPEDITGWLSGVQDVQVVNPTAGRSFDLKSIVQ